MSTTRRFGGTGLGLTISASLVKLMGGYIWVESDIGKGSTFHFTAQFRRDSKIAAVQEEAASAYGFGELTALVVDDNTTNLRIVQEMLESWGLRVESAESASVGCQCLLRRVAEGKPIPLVITDVNMPEIDGFAFTEVIRKNPSLSDTIIILLVSTDRTGDLERCEELRVAAHVMKPVRQSDLLDAIFRAHAVHQIVESGSGTRDDHPVRSSPGLRILLAEDGRLNQKVAVALLAELGHTVTIANDGKEAIDKLRSGPVEFDLVLMDVLMPTMDGLEAARAIRQQESGTHRHVPILAVTAQAMKGDRENCLAAGMDGYVTKPIRKDQLNVAIEKLFGHDPSVE